MGDRLSSPSGSEKAWVRECLNACNHAGVELCVTGFVSYRMEDRVLILGKGEPIVLELSTFQTYRWKELFGDYPVEEVLCSQLLRLTPPPIRIGKDGKTLYACDNWHECYRYLRK